MLRTFINRLISLWRPKPALEKHLARAVERFTQTKSPEDFSALSSLLSQWREQKGISSDDLSALSEDEPKILDRLACPECNSGKHLSGRGMMVDGNWHTRWSCVCGFKFTVEEFDEFDGSLQQRRENGRHVFKMGRRRR